MHGPTRQYYFNKVHFSLLIYCADMHFKSLDKRGENATLDDHFLVLDGPVLVVFVLSSLGFNVFRFEQLNGFHSGK